MGGEASLPGNCQIEVSSAVWSESGLSSKRIGVSQKGMKNMCKWRHQDCSSNCWECWPVLAGAGGFLVLLVCLVIIGVIICCCVYRRRRTRR